MNLVKVIIKVIGCFDQDLQKINVLLIVKFYLDKNTENTWMFAVAAIPPEIIEVGLFEI